MFALFTGEDISLFLLPYSFRVQEKANPSFAQASNDATPGTSGGYLVIVSRNLFKIKSLYPLPNPKNSITARWSRPVSLLVKYNLAETGLQKGYMAESDLVEIRNKFFPLARNFIFLCSGSPFFTRPFR
jgi:hypothetical protein